MDFDYRGYSEEYLQKICSKADLDVGRTKWKYGCTENYSQGRLYRECAHFPEWKSIYIYSEHGIEFDEIEPEELNNDAEALFVYSDGKMRNYQKVSDKPVYKVLHPFIWYRHAYCIEKDANARGTLAFPAHSTARDDSRFDVEAYIAMLKALPEEMQPVCACIYVADVAKGRHKPFVENGIPVYTAGNGRDIRFVDRYYEVLKRFKYSTSNLIGSYTFYSVEMGIPFSLVGDQPRFFDNDKADWNTKVIEQEEVAKRLFYGIHREISEEQGSFVASKLNVDDHISPEEMHDIMVRAYQKRGHVCSDLLKYASRTVRQKIKKLLKR